MKKINIFRSNIVVKLLRYAKKLNPLKFCCLLVFALPLIVVPFQAELTKPLRWGLIVALALGLLLNGYVYKNVMNLNKASVLVAGALLILIILSSLTSHEATSVWLVGWENEFLGLVSWVAFFLIAFGLRGQIVSLLSSTLSLYAGLAILLFSLIMDYTALHYGYRLSGLLFQATSMGMFSASLLFIAVWQALYGKGDKKHFLIYGLMGLAGIAVLLTQSRIAQVTAVIVCGLVSVDYLFRFKRLHVVPIVVGALMILAPIVCAGYFQRLQGEQVQTGISYRSDIYRASLDEALEGNNILLGNGASGVPEKINSRQEAPPGLVESLDKGFMFLSSHDLFLDIALCFGLTGGILFIFLVLQASVGLLVRKLSAQDVLIGGFFIVALLNAMFNVPSIEMTLIMFVLLVSLLPDSKTKTKSKTANKLPS